MLSGANEDRKSLDAPLSSGWSFTESEEAAFFKSVEQRKTISYLSERRVGHISPRGFSIGEGCRVVQQGLNRLASQSLLPLDTAVLKMSTGEVLLRLGEVHCADEFNVEDRTLCFQMEDSDLFMEYASLIPDLIQSDQPGYELCIYRMQYCFESDEKGCHIFLKLEFSEEIMAYTAAVTLANWSRKANFKIDLACSDLNKARFFRTLICRKDMLFNLDTRGSGGSVNVAQASSGGILAKAKHTFRLEEHSGLSLDIDKGDDNDSFIVRLQDAEQAATFLLSIPEANIDGIRPLKYHIPAFQPKWCKRCHRFGHVHEHANAICDISLSYSGCGACATSGANIPAHCGGPQSDNLRSCWTYALKEAHYEGQRMRIEAIDNHALVPLNIVVRRHESWARETYRVVATQSESDIEKAFQSNEKLSQKEKRFSDVGIQREKSQKVEGSPLPSSGIQGSPIEWGYSWHDLSLSFWEPKSKK